MSVSVPVKIWSWIFYSHLLVDHSPVPHDGVRYFLSQVSWHPMLKHFSSPSPPVCLLQYAGGCFRMMHAFFNYFYLDVCACLCDWMCCVCMPTNLLKLELQASYLTWFSELWSSVRAGNMRPHVCVRGVGGGPSQKADWLKVSCNITFWPYIYKVYAKYKWTAHSTWVGSQKIPY